MKRGDARELAVHLIYGRAFTGEEPEQVVSTRLNKEYYEKLAEENEVYAQRPDRFQLRYIDSVVTGVANREDELDDVIRQFSIGWDISRMATALTESGRKRLARPIDFDINDEATTFRSPRIMAS